MCHMSDTALRMKTTVIHTRIDVDLKIGAENVLKQLGLSSSEAVRMFYRQIELNQGIPFDVKIPNKLTAETLSKSARDEDVYQASDVDDLFDQLGI
jgi:DNA-damage-inducible protein J